MIYPGLLFLIFLMGEVVVFCIVVTYNGSKWIEKCLSSLYKSTVSLKIIAIDNASSDDTVTLIKEKFPLVSVIETGSNLGFGQANNIGLKIALKENADYVFLLNQDAWIKENTIEELLKAAKDNQEYGILSPFHLDVSENKLERLFQEFLSSDYTGELTSDMFFCKKKEIYETTYVHAASWFISKRCVAAVGGFDPLYFHYGEDDDYLQRARYFNFKIGLVPSALIVHDSVYNSWEKVEWNKNRNMVIALQQLKKMSPHFRSNVLSFFKSGFDELTTLMVLRKFRKFRFKFSVLSKAIFQMPKVHKSFKASFMKGAFLDE